MAYTTIDDPSEYFHIQLYTGNNTDDRSITNDANAGDFSPDWLWIKNRSGTNGHALVDTTRGATKVIRSNATNAEETEANAIQAFETDGFQIGTSGLVNTNSNNYVAWQWKANGGSASASGSESGNNVAYSRQTNSTAGISIITYTGIGTSGSGSPVVPHGLGAVPDMLIIKNRTSNSTDWAIWFKVYNSSGSNVFQGFNNNAFGGSGGSLHFGDVAPDSTNVSLGAVPGSGDTASTKTNTDGDNYIMFAFKETKGYSKFGSYKGNGNANGTFVYTGFEPAFLLFKLASAAGEHWRIFDNKRSPSNQVGRHLFPALDGAESSETGGDFLSNGFKWRNADDHQNGSGKTYVYMAFAEHPFVSSKGVPGTAK